MKGTLTHAAVGCAWALLAVWQLLVTLVFVGFPQAIPLLAIGLAFGLMSVSIVASPRLVVVAASLVGGIALIAVATVEWLQNPINWTWAAAVVACGLWIATASGVLLLRRARARAQ